MKATIGLLAILISVPYAQAETFSHPCEQVYYDLHTKEDDSAFDLNYLLNCQDTFGESKTIKKAEEHKRALEDRLDKVEKRIQERIAVAKGDRQGKLVRTFDVEDMKSHPKNVLRDAIAKKVIVINTDDSRKEHEISDNHVCKFFGYDKATNSMVSREVFARSSEKMETAPKTLLEFRKTGVFGLGKVEPKRYDFEKKKPYMYFSYFTSLTCERNVQDGDVIEDFEIDVESVRAQVEAEIKYPEADEDVLRILGMSRSAAEEIDDFQATYGEQEEEESWKAPSVGGDDFFIVTPQ